jgi:hypothetical protein
MGRTLILAMVMTTVAAAQTQTQAPRIATGDLRHHIFVMEGALQRAVQFGALQVNREMRSVSPELFGLAGDTSARGVYLEDYGVYFDVGVPVLRPSMLWSWQRLQEREVRDTRELIEEFKRFSATERDPAKRRAFDAMVTRLEATLQPAGGSAMPTLGPQVGNSSGTVGAQVALPETTVGAATTTTTPAPSLAAGAPTPTPNSRVVAGSMILKDPNRAYTEAVQRALVDAMIDYSGPMLIAPNEWLTVAARDNAPRDLFAPQDPFDEVVTILLRIRGEDLAAYRAAKIDRDEVKKRVQLKEF